MSSKKSGRKGGMEGGPGEQADRGTHGAFESEPDVRIPPHETEGSWSIGEREKRAPGTAVPRETEKTGTKTKKTKKTKTKE